MTRDFHINTLILGAAIVFTACGDKEDEAPDTGCTDRANFVFNEVESIVLVEFEEAIFSEDWSLVRDDVDASGRGYMVWTGSQHLGNPGNGLARYKLNIVNPGTYRFIWRSAVKLGNSGTEHNDTWLRFADAADFYGEKNNGSIVYPNGTGQTPNPNGSSADGWFKVYRSGNDLGFKWQSSTSDNDAHQIYVLFDNPGVYTMVVSARSSGHAIDKFLLYETSVYTQTEATSADILSAISCD
jgi:hypothetical protein